jgi:hypothetical protein
LKKGGCEVEMLAKENRGKCVCDGLVVGKIGTEWKLLAG